MGETKIPSGVSPSEQKWIKAKPTKAGKSDQRTAEAAKKGNILLAATKGASPSTPVSGTKLRSAPTSTPPVLPGQVIKARSTDVKAARELFPGTKEEPTTQKSLDELKEASQLGSHEKIIYGEGGKVQVKGRSFSHLFFPSRSGKSFQAREAVQNFYTKAQELAKKTELSPSQLQDLQKAVKDFSNSKWYKKVLERNPGLSLEAEKFQKSFKDTFLKEVDILSQTTENLKQEDVEALQHTLAELESSLPLLETPTDPLALAREKTLQLAGKIYSEETEEIGKKTLSNQLNAIQGQLNTGQLDKLDAYLVVDTIGKIAARKNPTLEDLNTLNKALKLIEDSSSFKEMKAKEPNEDIITKLMDSRKTLDTITLSKISTKSEDKTSGTRAVRFQSKQALKAAGLPKDLSTAYNTSQICGQLAKSLISGEEKINFGTQCKPPLDEDKVQMSDLPRNIGTEEQLHIYTKSLEESAEASKKTQINIASAYSMNTHPESEGKRDGDPIADDAQMAMLHTGNPDVDVVLYSGADGCNWGEEPCTVAQLANSEYIKECSNQLQGKQLTLETLANTTMAGFAKANQAVESHKPPEGMRPGSTTHTGMIILKDKGQDHKSYAVFSTVGDMKVFIRGKDGTIREPTQGNRGGDDPKDPGGRLPSDFGNLSLYVVELSPGDTILPMSDGVHDNLEPDTLGLTPEETYKELIGNSSTLPPKEKEALKNDSFLASMVQDLGKQWEGALNSPWAPGQKKYLSPLADLKALYMKHKIGLIDRERSTDQTLGNALVNHALKASSPYRTAQEKAVGKTVMTPVFEIVEKDGKRENIRHMNLTGKTDHVSCGSITI